LELTQIHGFPMVATSIGLAVGGVPVLGVIYNPFLDLLVRNPPVPPDVSTPAPRAGART
jgi:3'-phosphoadenosine 5'-phosphosulfate (PAPS) 3'-phosphatase